MELLRNISSLLILGNMLNQFIIYVFKINVKYYHEFVLST